FIKNTKLIKSDGPINRSQSERLEFWTTFNKELLNRKKPFNIRKASTDHWYDVSIGTSDAHISITLVNKDGHVGVELYISDNKDLFDKLYDVKEVIENQLSFSLDWQRLDNKKASRIITKITGLDYDDKSNYDELMNQVIFRVIEMREIFTNYI